MGAYFSIMCSNRLLSDYKQALAFCVCSLCPLILLNTVISANNFLISYAPQNFLESKI